MTHLALATPRLRLLLIPLLLAACPGKEGLLTDHGSDASSSSSSAGTESAGTTTDGITDPTTTLDAATGPAVDTTTTTDTTGLLETTTPTAPITESSNTTAVESTGGETTIENTSDSMGPNFSSNAALYNDCAPNDGAAFRIEIGVTSPTCDALWPTPDTFRIVLFQMAPVAPGEYLLGFPNEGDALLDNGDGSPQSSTEGKVIIESWQGDHVAGTYDVILDGGTHLSGSFAGPYCGGPFLCG